MKQSFEHPHDTPLSSGLRFAVEIIAWSAGPWAAATMSLWLIAPTLIFLVGLPAIFSTVGDKRNVIVPTPGGARFAIEAMLHIVAVGAPWLVWPVWAAILASAVFLLAYATGLPRSIWLLKGAPLD